MAENTLPFRESNKLYKQIINNASDYIALIDLRGRFLYLSPSFQHMGYRPEYLAGKSAVDMLHPKDREEVSALLAGYAKKIVKAKASALVGIKKEVSALRINFRFPDKSGNWHDIESAPSIIENPLGKGHAILLILRDITEQKQARERIKQVDEVWETTFNSVPELVSIQGTDYRILRVNKAYADFFKMTPDELVGRRCYEVVHGTKKPLPNCPLKQLLKAKKPVTIEFFEPRSGVYLEVTASPIFNDKGEISAAVHIARDITERKRAEEKIRESEARFRRISDLTLEGIVIHDKGKILELNPSLARMFGYAPDELIGTSGFDFLTPESKKLLSEKLKAGSEEPYELIGVKKDGTHFPVEIHGRNISWNGCSVRMGTVYDITERKKAEKALKESEEKYRTLVGASNDLIWMLDEKGRVLFINKVAEKLGGYKLEEIRGRQFSMGIKKQDLPKVKAAVKKTFRGTPQKYEASVYGRTGRQIVLSVSAAPIYSNGKVAGVVSFGEDITEKKTEEEDLLKFKLGLERSNDAAFITDIDGAITYVNPAFERIYGYKKEEAIGKTPRIIKSGTLPKSVYKQFWDTLLAKKVISGELVNKAKDGRLLTVEGSANPILDSKGNITGFLAIQHDITARKKLEEERNEAKQMMESIAEGIADEVVLISEDFKILWANKAVLKQTGYKMDEIIGNYCYKVMHRLEKPCKPPYDICPVEEAKRKGVFATAVHTHFDKNKNKVFVEITVYPIKNDKGEATRFVHITRDITVQKKAEETLERLNCDLKAKVDELERFNRLTVGRELKMIELKKRIAELEARQ